MSKHVPIKTVPHLSTQEFSKNKCDRVTHADLDKLIDRLKPLMSKKEKCDLVKTKADILIKSEKPKRKTKKVATNFGEKRSEQLFKEAGLTRRQMLSQKLKTS